MGYSIPYKESHVLKGHSGYVLVVKYNKNGQYCMTGGQDRAIRLWNPNRGTLIKTYDGHGYEVRDVVVSHDNARFASCGGDKMVFLWDIATGHTLRRFQGHFNRVNCVAMNDDSSLLFTGSYDSTVRIWDLRSQTGKPIQVLSEAKDSVSSLDVSMDEIVVSSIDGCIRTYDIRLGCLNCDEVSSSVTSAKLTHDGKCIIASTLKNTIILLDKSTGDVLNSYTGHLSKEYRIDCVSTPNDDFIVSGSEDGSVHFWDIVDAKLHYSLPNIHKNAVCSISLHPQENKLLTASIDGYVKVWTDT